MNFTHWSCFCLLRGFPDGSVGKESARNVGDLGLIPGLGRSPGEGKGYPLQYSSPENSKTKESTRLSDFHSGASLIAQLANNLPVMQENPRDGGAWWAAVYGVTQSRTRLK